MSTVWENALEAMRSQLSEHTFVAWLAPLRFHSFESPVLRVSIPHRFFADWISPRYLPDLLAAFGRESEQPCLSVDWIIEKEERNDSTQLELDAEPESYLSPSSYLTPAARRAEATPGVAKRASARAQVRAKDKKTGDLPLEGPFVETPQPVAVARPAPVAPRPSQRPGASDANSEYALNPRYGFENFIVGTSNQLAHAAGIAASSSPGKRYNPLFIYSKVGLGKTHLVNAVGHRVREDRPEARVLFLSAERFTNEFISALQHRRIDEFRARYRNHCDVLIIDDIQFLAGREQTQEEFFHTFNALYHADKQIVVTSDVYPQQIVEMQDRLISRFQWGLIADIQAPELDTRIAILRKKAEVENIHLPDDTALFVAQRVQSNVRELEGTLLRLAVRADVEGKGIDIALAKAMLGEPNRELRERQTSVEDVQKAACEYYGLTMKELLSDRRHRGVSLPRMVAMYVTRERLKLSYPDIGRRFGGKDHTTVISGYRKIQGLLETDEQVQRAVERIEKQLGLR